MRTHVMSRAGLQTGAMTNFRWERADLPAVLPLRELYRQEMNCQIIHDSLPARFHSPCYLASQDGSTVSYAILDDRPEGPLTLYEFYVLPNYRRHALMLLREVLEISQATTIRSQTNDRPLSLLLYDVATKVSSETILFAHAQTTHHPPPEGAAFRMLTDADAQATFNKRAAEVGPWAIIVHDRFVATDGALYHYNPPYADVHMAVAESDRRKGYGSYLVQEIARVCYQSGKLPVARCNEKTLDHVVGLRKLAFCRAHAFFSAHCPDLKDHPSATIQHHRSGQI